MATAARSTTPAAGQWLAWIGLVLLCLVGGRGLVVCDGPHCHSRIEFAHSGRDCCTTHHDCDSTDRHHGDDDDSGLPHTDHVCGDGCSDSALGLETGPLPQRLLPPAAGNTALAALAWLPPRFDLAEDASWRLPPPTGPPRIDCRTLLRSTTVLRF